MDVETLSPVKKGAMAYFLIFYSKLFDNRERERDGFDNNFDFDHAGFEGHKYCQVLLVMLSSRHPTQKNG